MKLLIRIFFFLPSAPFPPKVRGRGGFCGGQDSNFIRVVPLPLDSKVSPENVLWSCRRNVFAQFPRPGAEHFCGYFESLVSMEIKPR